MVVPWAGFWGSVAATAIDICAFVDAAKLASQGARPAEAFERLLVASKVGLEVRKPLVSRSQAMDCWRDISTKIADWLARLGGLCTSGELPMTHYDCSRQQTFEGLDRSLDGIKDLMKKAFAAEVNMEYGPQELSPNTFSGSTMLASRRERAAWATRRARSPGQPLDEYDKLEEMLRGVRCKFNQAVAQSLRKGTGVRELREAEELMAAWAKPPAIEVVEQDTGELC
jgi:hypothetical protein